MGMADKLLAGLQGSLGGPTEANPNTPMMIDPNQITKEMSTLGGSPASAYAHLRERQDPNFQQTNQYGEIAQLLQKLGLGGMSGGAGASGDLPSAGAPMPPDQAMPPPMDLPPDLGAAKNLVQYTVKPGDNLITIAKRVYGDPTKFKQIARANGISDANVIQPGQKLMIPPQTGEV